MVTGAAVTVGLATGTVGFAVLAAGFVTAEVGFFVAVTDFFAVDAGLCVEAAGLCVAFAVDVGFFVEAAGFDGGIDGFFVEAAGFSCEEEEAFSPSEPLVKGSSGRGGKRVETGLCAFPVVAAALVVEEAGIGSAEEEGTVGTLSPSPV